MAHWTIKLRYLPVSSVCAYFIIISFGDKIDLITMRLNAISDRDVWIHTVEIYSKYSEYSVICSHGLQPLKPFQFDSCVYSYTKGIRHTEKICIQIRRSHAVHKYAFQLNAFNTIIITEWYELVIKIALAHTSICNESGVRFTNDVSRIIQIQRKCSLVVIQ